MGARKLLKASADSKNIKLGKTIHAHLIISYQVSPDHIIEQNSLINLYSKCGDIRAAHKVFDEIPEKKKNIVTWGSIMGGYLHQGEASRIIQLSKNMAKTSNLRPNEYVLATILSSCSASGLLEEGRQWHCYSIKSGLIFHQYVKNALVHMYSICNDTHASLQVMNSTSRSDLCTYNTALKALLDHGDLIKARCLLQMMVVECRHDDWDSLTCVNIFGACGSLKDLTLGRQVHGRMVKSGVDFDLFMGSSAIDMYGKCGEVLCMRKVFDELVDKNTITWTAALTAYLQNNHFEEALKLFLRMEVVPNEYTFAVILNSCAAISAFGYGSSFHAGIEKIGMKVYMVVANSLINMYSKCGSIRDAYAVFNSLSHYDDVVSWNLMMTGFAHHGLGEEALNLFQQILVENWAPQPSYVTFVTVLSVCAMLGRLDEAFHFLNHTMRNFEVNPGVEHYTCIVGVLCRVGKLNEALHFVASTPLIQRHIIAWRILLNSCYVHQNYDLGKRVADMIFFMNPDDTGISTLVSNMHAKSRRWDKVETLQKSIKERNVKKEPGSSWIEIQGNTHVFVAGGFQHVENVQIRAKVREILTEVKSMGYIADVSWDVHDVEVEQKEDNLSYHSEKLAIALAMIEMPPGAPIRVMKNLRMCNDCHSFAKLTSKMAKREIVVRDVNCFHRFVDGHCSCGDYW